MLFTERWAWSWSQCTSSQLACGFKQSTWQWAAITFRLACCYLPSQTASLPFGQLQIILLDDIIIRELLLNRSLFHMFRLAFYHGCNLYSVMCILFLFYITGTVRFACMICFWYNVWLCAIVTLSLKAIYLSTYLLIVNKAKQLEFRYNYDQIIADDGY